LPLSIPPVIICCNSFVNILSLNAVERLLFFYIFLLPVHHYGQIIFFHSVFE
jgi:hypothetical protein